MVLPWSTWAMMAMFRKSFLSVSIRYSIFVIRISDDSPQTTDHGLSSVVYGLTHTKTPDGKAEGFFLILSGVAKATKSKDRRADNILSDCDDFG